MLFSWLLYTPFLLQHENVCSSTRYLTNVVVLGTSIFSKIFNFLQRFCATKKMWICLGFCDVLASFAIFAFICCANLIKQICHAFALISYGTAISAAHCFSSVEKHVTHL